MLRSEINSWQGFGFKDTAVGTFVTIQTNTTTLHLTPDHYIPVCTTLTAATCHSWENVPAHSVRTGQAIMVMSSGEHHLAHFLDTYRWNASPCSKGQGG